MHTWTSFETPLTPLRRLRVLVTGFRDFDADQDGVVDTNPTKRLAQVVANRIGSVTAATSEGEAVVATVEGHVLDVTWSRAGAEDVAPPGAADVLEELVKARRPDLVVTTGATARRSGAFSVSSMATDFDVGRIAYGEPQGRSQYTVGKGAPEFELATALPIEAIHRAWQAQNVAFVPEATAGNYICNDIFYRLLWMRSRTTHGRAVLRGGFVHMAIDVTEDAAILAIRALIGACLSTLSRVEIEGTR